jgi:hypothetical protein
LWALRKYRRGGRWDRHCRAAFIKHVLPWFTNPRPTSFTWGRGGRSSSKSAAAAASAAAPAAGGAEAAEAEVTAVVVAVGAETAVAAVTDATAAAAAAAAVAEAAEKGEPTTPLGCAKGGGPKSVGGIPKGGEGFLLSMLPCPHSSSLPSSSSPLIASSWGMWGIKEGGPRPLEWGDSLEGTDCRVLPGVYPEDCRSDNTMGWST